MWIFCCGMMRSGSTVQYQIAKDLVERFGLGEGVGFAAPNAFPQMYAKNADPSRIYVAKCHLFIPSAIPLFERGHAKGIYIYRDLRDVIVSWANKSRTSFREVMATPFVDTLLTSDLLWTSMPNTTVSVYETMMDDMASEVRSIASTLGVNLGEAEIQRLAEEYGIDKQKERIEGFDYKSEGVNEGGHSIYNPETHLHHNHIHSGASEQWRSAISDVEVRLLEERVGGWLVEHGYRLSSSASKRVKAAKGGRESSTARGLAI